MLTEYRQSKWKTSGIIYKKIASIGVWGNGRFPQLNLPSALAVAKQGYSFLFAYRVVPIAFIVGLVLHRFCWKYICLFNWIFDWYWIASRQLKSNLLLSFWQIKKNTLTGIIGIVGIENCFNQKNNTHLKQFLYLQCQYENTSYFFLCGSIVYVCLVSEEVMRKDKSCI